MDFDIAIIGAGPGGYVAAIRAAQLGAKVALIEKENLGGCCLNWGCIPTKTVLASADRYNEAKKLSKFGISFENLSFDYKKVFDRKQNIIEKIRKNLAQLIKSYKIQVFFGEAHILSANSLKVEGKEQQEINFKNLILATGSSVTSFPDLQIDHKFVIDSNDVLLLETLPEHILIVGSGAIGTEWARIFDAAGKKVSIVEIAPKLAPMFDIEISDRLERLYKRKRIEFFTETKIEKIEQNIVYLSNGKQISPDAVFLAVGRKPNLDIQGLDCLNIAKNGRFIAVDDNMKTNVDNVYAIGDITGILPLAHVASHQGVVAVEHMISGKNSKIAYNAVPKIVYGHPEIATVGENEQDLTAKGIVFEKSVFPVAAVGKNVVEDEIEGFVKVLASNGKILGVHMLCLHSSIMIQQAVIAMNAGLSVEQMKETVFAHPTLSESLYEAFLGIDGKSLHLLNMG